MSVVGNINDKEDMKEAEAKMSKEDWDLVQQEWKFLLSELRMFVSDVNKSYAEESDTEVEMGRCGSADSPFPSTVSSSEIAFDDDLESLLPAYAVALGKENNPTPSSKGKGKMVADFGAPGDYKNSVAFRRALPALVARRPLIGGGGDSQISGGSEREACEPTWNIPSYGVIAECDSNILAAQTTKERVEMWLAHAQWELDNHSIINDLPPIFESEDETKADWDDLDEPSKENFMVTPTPSEVAFGLTAPGSDSETCCSDQSLSGETAAEDADNDHLFGDGNTLPDKLHEAMPSTSEPPLSDAMTDCATEYESDIDPHTIPLPSSRDSASDLMTNNSEEPLEAYYAARPVWTWIGGRDKLSERARKRLDTVGGRGKIAGENVGEARHLFSGHPRASNWRLEDFAQFLEDEPADDEEWARLVEAFEWAFDRHCGHRTFSWPERSDGAWDTAGSGQWLPYHSVDPSVEDWELRDLIRRNVRPVHVGVVGPDSSGAHPMAAAEFMPAPEPMPALELATAEEEEEWALEQEELREERMENAIARGRAAGIIDGLAAYRKAHEPDAEEQTGDHTSDSDPYRPGPAHPVGGRHSPAPFLRPDGLVARSELDGWDRWLQFLDEDGYRIAFEELVQLEVAWHEAYDFTFGVANTAGFAGPPPNHIPSLEDFEAGRERVSYSSRQ
ncbi:hypothetical protein CONLIGDRAFT_686253 [Coniochaeta ligniaria NRRL 30616]|uniref:Uncharacterized protein n=1 Tax=Coniochaeta ligniaria NRRL 30616 TaxID=1408157 RepID=A0A1J7I8R8_9PEZI|nr:hypothetical protein CONLIGDRAFT_686253 [Coniochaeta ligniaria NRRL 30616]